MIYIDVSWNQSEDNANWIVWILDWPTSVGLQAQKVTSQLSSIMALLFVLHSEVKL